MSSLEDFLKTNHLQYSNKHVYIYLGRKLLSKHVIEEKSARFAFSRAEKIIKLEKWINS